MALKKLKLANKIAKHEAKRRTVRKNIVRQRRDEKIRRKRTRKLMLEGRREYQAKRKADAAYIKKLEGEINEEA